MPKNEEDISKEPEETASNERIVVLHEEKG